MIVVGGSGITFGLSVIKDLVDKDLKGKSRAKVIEFIWTVPDAGKSAFLLPYGWYPINTTPSFRCPVYSNICITH